MPGLISYGMFKKKNIKFELCNFYYQFGMK